jgi:hypothetical protein
MPSSHACSLYFLLSFLLLCEFIATPPLSAYVAVSQTAYRAALFGVAVFCVTGTAVRVRHGLHTIAQVSVGAVVGAVAATLWFALLQLARRQRFLSLPES